MSVRKYLLTHRCAAVPLALTCGLLVLGGCSTGGTQADTTTTADGTTSAGATGSPADPTAGTPAADGSPAVDTDAVQTDAPVDSASLVLARAEWSPGLPGIEAAAFVQGLVETGGECTAVAEPADGGDAVSSEATEAEPGPATTECGALAVVLPEGSTGAWAVTVTYTSGSTELGSETVTVDVP
ncbi:hypothetical protein ACI8AV_05255 [Geodermatophilus sp. SYSU D00804]